MMGSEVMGPVLFKPSFLKLQDVSKAALYKFLIDYATRVWVAIQLGVWTRKTMGIMNKFMSDDTADNIVWNFWVGEMASDGYNRAPLG